MDPQNEYSLDIQVHFNLTHVYTSILNLKAGPLP